MKKNFIMIFLGVILLLVTFIFTTNKFDFFKTKINKEDKAVITTIVEQYHTYSNAQDRIDFCKSANKEFVLYGGDVYSCYDYYSASKEELINKYGIGTYINYQHTIVDIEVRENSFNYNDTEIKFYEYSVTSKYVMVDGGNTKSITYNFYFVPHNNTRYFSLENHPRHWRMFN